MSCTIFHYSFELYDTQQRSDTQTLPNDISTMWKNLDMYDKINNLQKSLDTSLILFSVMFFFHSVIPPFFFIVQNSKMFAKLIYFLLVWTKTELGRSKNFLALNPTKCMLLRSIEGISTHIIMRLRKRE